MCHLSAQPHTNIHTHIQHKMQLSVQRCAILTEYVKRCAILALSHTQTYTHTCIQVHTHTTQNAAVCPKMCRAILTEYVKKCAILALKPHTNIHTHMHTSRIQHKMQLSVQRCAILTEYVKRCAILALSHTQTYTHTCIQVHTYTTQNAAVCPKMCHLDRVL